MGDEFEIFSQKIIDKEEQERVHLGKTIVTIGEILKGDGLMKQEVQSVAAQDLSKKKMIEQNTTNLR